jgi:hypothetical protein
MPQLSASLAAWGTEAFADTLCAEIHHLGASQLPLQDGLRHGSYALDEIQGAMLLRAEETPRTIQATVGVFYAGIIAGCNCADDPTPVEAQEEYCEIRLVIDRADATTHVTLTN